MNPKHHAVRRTDVRADPEMVKEVLDVMVDAGGGKRHDHAVRARTKWASRRKVADRVIFMDRGEIIEENTPDEFFDHPQERATKLFLSQILRFRGPRAAPCVPAGPGFGASVLT